jgi:hypothetical protein
MVVAKLSKTCVNCSVVIYESTEVGEVLFDGNGATVYEVMGAAKTCFAAAWISARS